MLSKFSEWRAITSTFSKTVLDLDLRTGPRLAAPQRVRSEKLRGAL